MDLATVLSNAQSPNQELRTQSEAFLNDAIEKQYDQFLYALCEELATEDRLTNNRRLAGIYIKNLITAQDEALLEAKKQKWLACAPGVKDQIRLGFMQALRSREDIVCHTTASVVAAFGAVDVPNGEWPTLFQDLLTNIHTPESSEGCKIASLESLGYMCEAMNPETVDPQVTNKILSAIIDGMKTERSNPIKLAAVTALNNSLELSEQNFANDAERDTIMRSICEATQVNDALIRAKAFDCFATVAELYYDKLQTYVETIFNLSVQTIKTDNAAVAMQAIEFWNVVADMEVNYKAENEDLPDNEKVAVFNFIEVSAPTLIPLLLEHMTKQQDYDDEDSSWNISTAAAALLECISLTIEDKCLPHILPFIQANINSTEWRLKEASIMAFGMILEGPSQGCLGPIVNQALQFLIPAMRDQHPHVRDTAAWTLGRIFQFHKTAIPPNSLESIVGGLLAALDDSEPKIIAQTCFAVHNLAEAVEDEADKPNNFLSFFMPQMLMKLLAVSSRHDWEVENIRESAFEAMDMMVANAAQDMIPVITQLLDEVINRIEVTCTTQLDQVTGSSGTRLQMQSCLCILCNEIVKKLDETQFANYADKIMALVFSIFNIPNAPAHEDAMSLISSIAEKTGTGFQKYMPYLQPVLLKALQNVEESQLVLVSLGVVGDLCRALEKGFDRKLCDEIVKILLMLLQDTKLKRSVKPQVISVFSDIAMAIEGEFDRYFQHVVPYLMEAGRYNLEDQTDDEELVDTMNALRDAILEAYIGITMGFKQAKKTDLMLGHLDDIVDFIKRCVGDRRRSVDVLRSSIGLLGDLGGAFPQKMKPIFQDPSIPALLQQGKDSDEKCQEQAEYTEGIQRTVLSYTA